MLEDLESSPPHSPLIFIFLEKKKKNCSKDIAPQAKMIKGQLSIHGKMQEKGKS
jgi:hypothetical protein